MTKRSHRRTSSNKSIDHVFHSSRLSTQENKDMSYKEIGIIHVTDAAGVNVIRAFGNEIANAFGAKGFDNKVFDEARTRALFKMRSKLEDGQKVSNLRLEIQSSGADTSGMICVSAYGTLMQKQ
jgi:uncharacterized protein YbjQ (UPF0145 family)